MRLRNLNGGRYEQTVKAATQAPEEVSRVTYQTMDICTRGEPNRVMH
jgi:hypothetical protein